MLNALSGNMYNATFRQSSSQRLPCLYFDLFWSENGSFYLFFLVWTFLRHQSICVQNFFLDGHGIGNYNKTSWQVQLI